MAGVVGIAVGTVVVHLVLGWRYGFDRDELMALEDARHLAWGYVQYPPMTAFFGRVALGLFGTSLGGFRLFAALAQAGALVLTGLMAKEIAGKKWRVGSDEWRADPRGVLSAKDAERGGGPHFADSVRNDVFSCLRRRKPKSAGMKASATTAREPKTHPSQEALRVGHPEEEEAKNTGRSSGATGEWAAVVATLAGVPFCLGAGGLMQYISFDYLCWVLVAWCVVKVAVASGEWRVTSGADKDQPKSQEAARWWVGVGVGMGLGMMAKYTMGFLVCGVVAGVLFTEMRRYLRSGWLWLGLALAWAIWLLYLLWEWKRNFVSLEFLKFLHVRDVGEGLTNWFLLGQVEVTLLAVPLALAGLWFCFFSEEGERFRILGWMYAVPLAMFLVMRGRDYYLAPAYPMLYAAGAVWVEGKCGKWRVGSGEWRGEEPRSEEQPKNTGRSACATVRGVIWVCLVLDILVAGAVALPVAPVNSEWWKFASRVDSVFPEEIGWEEFVDGVAKVRDGLPAEDRARLGILAGNYGEVGALNLYGEKFGLPRAISGVNSSWERGYGEPAPEVFIVVGYPRELLEREFASCVVAGRTRNRFGVKNEETVEDPDIFVCRGMRSGWEEFWGRVRKFA